MLYYEAGVAARPLPRFGRCAPLVSTAALQPSFNGCLRLPSFSRGLRPLVSTQPLAASSIAWCARNVTPYPCAILEKSTYPRLSVSLRGPGSLRAFNGRCAPLVSTAALQPSFNGSLRLPSFSRGLSPLVSTQPLAASSEEWSLRFLSFNGRCAP